MAAAARTLASAPQPDVPDTRRITEMDADYTRLKAATVRKLTASLRQLVAELRAARAASLRGSPFGPQEALITSRFIARQTALLRDAYVAAWREGVRDYWAHLSNRGQRLAPTEHVDADRMRAALAFYAPSVAKIAQQAKMAAAQIGGAQQMLAELDRVDAILLRGGSVGRFARRIGGVSRIGGHWDTEPRGMDGRWVEGGPRTERYHAGGTARGGRGEHEDTAAEVRYIAHGIHEMHAHFARSMTPEQRAHQERAAEELARPAREQIARMFGRALSDHEVAALVGARAGDRVFVSDPHLSPDGQHSIHIHLIGRDGAYEASRVLSRESDGDLYMRNASFMMRERSQGHGVGAEVLARQVSGLARLGVSRITTHAARGNSLNGYYTWARLGYNGALQSDVMRRLSRSGVRGVATVQDLMHLGHVPGTKQSGAEWWREHGGDWDGEFNLAAGSRSRAILRAYLEEKGRKALADELHLREPARQQMRTPPDAEEIEWTDEDEAAAERAWKRLHEQWSRENDDDAGEDESPHVHLDELSDWQDGLAVRVGLQADLIWVGINDGYVRGAGYDHANPFRYLWWDLGLVKTRHCTDCPEIAAGSPYDMPGAGTHTIRQMPGDGQTNCGAGCKCSVRYGPGPELQLPAYAWEEYTLPRWAPPLPENIPDWELPGSTGGPYADEGPMNEYAPVARGEGQQDAYTWEEVSLLPPQSSWLSDEQRDALDLFRAKWNAWEAEREAAPNLPELPDMFALEADVRNSGTVADWESMWDALSPKQRALLLDLGAAIDDWNAATSAANAGFDPNAGPLGAGGNGGPQADTSLGEREGDTDDLIALRGFGGVHIIRRVGGVSRIGGHWDTEPRGMDGRWVEGGPRTERYHAGGTARGGRGEHEGAGEHAAGGARRLHAQAEELLARRVATRVEVARQMRRYERWIAAHNATHPKYEAAQEFHGRLVDHFHSLNGEIAARRANLHLPAEPERTPAEIVADARRALYRGRRGGPLGHLPSAERHAAAVAAGRAGGLARGRNHAARQSARSAEEREAEARAQTQRAVDAQRQWRHDHPEEWRARREAQADVRKAANKRVRERQRADRDMTRDGITVETTHPGVRGLFDTSAGHKLSDGQLAQLAGAQPGDRVTIDIRGLVARSADGAREHVAYLVRGDDGRLELFQVQFHDGAGREIPLDPRVLATQARAAHALGAHIAIKARIQASDHTTLPRLGYDTTMQEALHESHLNETNHYEVTRPLPEVASRVRTLSEFLATPEGARWWAENGLAPHMEFDPTPGSRSMRRLEEVVLAHNG